MTSCRQLTRLAGTSIILGLLVYVVIVVAAVVTRLLSPRCLHLWLAQGQVRRTRTETYSMRACMRMSRTERCSTPFIRTRGIEYHISLKETKNHTHPQNAQPGLRWLTLSSKSFSKALISCTDLLVLNLGAIYIPHACRKSRTLRLFADRTYFRSEATLLCPKLA